MSKICDLCKSENDDLNQFCDKCGNPLVNFDAPPEPARKASPTVDVDQGAVDTYLKKAPARKPSGGKLLVIPILLLIGALAFFWVSMTNQKKMKDEASAVVKNYLENIKNEQFSKALEDGIGVPLGQNMEDSLKEFMRQLTPEDPRNVELEKAKLDLVTLGDGVEKYYYINRRLPTSLNDLSPVIIEALPAAPGGGEFGYEYRTESDNYTIFVKGLQFEANGLPKDFPAYSKIDKLQAPGQKKVFSQWKLTGYDILDVQLGKDEARVVVRETDQFGAKTIQIENTYVVKKKSETQWVIDVNSSPIQELNLSLSYTQLEPFGGVREPKPPETKAGGDKKEGKKDEKKDDAAAGETPVRTDRSAKSNNICLGTLLLTFSKVATRDNLIMRSQKQYRITSDAMEEISLALNRFYNRNDGKYPKSLLWLIPKFIRQIPENPVVMEDTFTRSYQVSDDRENFTIYCDGSYFLSLGVEPNFPQYSSRFRFIPKSSAIPEEEEIAPEDKKDEKDKDVKKPDGDKDEKDKDVKKPDGDKDEKDKDIKKPDGDKDEKEKDVKKPDGDKDEKDKDVKKPDGDKDEKDKDVKKPDGKKDEKSSSADKDKESPGAKDKEKDNK